MKSYIKAIVIFNKEGEKRIISLQQGVNIITGQSKTGKSALVEIIDYCLCSTRCTIPKGIITDFSYLYVLVLETNKEICVIGRHSWENGARMYFAKENKTFDPSTLELDYFSNLTSNNVKSVQYEIESILGLHVSNIPDESGTGKKASLRNMTSYLFQHQNLIANKFALFYRFTDYYKRKDTIDQFPIFAGIISQDYYSKLIELNNLETSLKHKNKQKKSDDMAKKYIEDNLYNLVYDYFALLGLSFNKKISFNDLLKAAKNLPSFDDTNLFNESAIIERYNELNKQLEQLRTEEKEVILKIKSIENNRSSGDEFQDILETLKEKTIAAPIESTTYNCPFCGQECNEITKNDFQIINASKWLNNEIQITKRYTSDFSEESRKLNDLQSELETRIRNIWKQIRSIERKYISSNEIITKKDKIHYAKARIESFLEMSDFGIFNVKEDEINQLKEKIDTIKNELSKYDISYKINKAQQFLSNNMNRIAKGLDFEEEYKPINLHFGLTDKSFDLYQQAEYDKVHLYEMGSGANWVSCHIALFLSFLHYFSLEEKSPMPSFLFFDQPSQVYFPESNENESLISQTDLSAVNNIYKTIFDEINLIGEEAGFLPQIIIVDHVDGNDLDIKEEFLKYRRYNWRDGKALI